MGVKTLCHVLSACPKGQANVTGKEEFDLCLRSDYLTDFLNSLSPTKMSSNDGGKGKSNPLLMTIVGL